MLEYWRIRCECKIKEGKGELVQQITEGERVVKYANKNRKVFHQYVNLTHEEKTDILVQPLSWKDFYDHMLNSQHEKGLVDYVSPANASPGASARYTSVPCPIYYYQYIVSTRNCYQ